MYFCPVSLSEFAVRDLNDEINKLIKEKGRWEWRIKELGGPDYRVGLYVLCAVQCDLNRTFNPQIRPSAMPSLIMRAVMRLEPRATSESCLFGDYCS